MTTVAALVAAAAVGCGAAGDEAGTGSGATAATGSAAAVACEQVGDPAQAETTVQVTLDEWSVQPATNHAAAGTVAFEAANAGAEPHELVVVRGDDPDALPVDDDGAVDEAALPAGAVVGEIETFPAGETCAGAFGLEPGSYVLLCNLVEREDGEAESHYQLGMRTAFTVSGGEATP